MLSSVILSFGEFFKVCSHLLLAVMLLLLSKGWCLSTEKIENKSFFIIIGSAAAFYLFVRLWGSARDQAVTFYVYDSLPGFIIVLTDICGKTLI